MKNKALLIIFLILPISLHGVETDIIQNKEVIVLFERPLKNTAKDVAEIYPAVKAELEQTLRWRLDFRPTVMIIKDSKTFQKITDSNLVVAVAMPKKNLIVIDSSKMKTHPFTLEVTLKHELCHLLLHRHIRGGNLPKWLNEGVSQWVSDGIAEIIIGGEKDLLKQATLSGRFINLKDLTKEFPEDQRSLLLAYEESKSIVEYISREFGTDGVLRVLSYLRNGDEVDVAILKGLSISQEELEKKWHGYLRKRITWFTYLSDNIYKILFFLAALTTIYGFIRLLIKKRRYKDEEEDTTGQKPG